MNALTLVAAVLPPTLGMAVVGVLYLSALRRLAKAEADRDRYWDMASEAAVIIAADAPGETTEAQEARE